MPLGTEVGLGPGDFVLDGDPAPLPKKGAKSQIIGSHLLWPNGCMDQDGTSTAVGLSPGDCVRWAPSPFPKGGEPAPQFSAHFYCGQTAGCIKMPLGMEVDLSQGDFVLDGDPPPPKKGEEPLPPKFSVHVYCGQTAGWIKTALGTEIGLGPGDFVLDGDQAPSIKRRQSLLPNFRPMSIAAKRLIGSRCHLVRR